MKKYAYTKVFSLSVVHDYLGTAISRAMGFTAGPATASLAARYGFYLQNLPSGFDFYTNAPTAWPQFLQYIQKTTGDTFFDFEITVPDTMFFQYTDLPVNQTGPLNFGSNNAAVSNQQIQLNLQLGNDPLAQQQGRVVLYFDDLIKNTVDNTPVTFNIHFSARATQWQYYIVNRSKVKMDQPGIINKSGMRFDGPDAVTIATGEQALFFSSGQNLLSLGIYPKYRFDLVNYTQSAGSGTEKIQASKTVFKGLPAPDPGRMNIEWTNGIGQAISPIYVYI